MTIATIILSLIGVAICLVGVIKDKPSAQSLGILFTMVALILGIISEL